MVPFQIVQQQLCLKVYLIFLTLEDFGKLLKKYKINLFYTAPTALRALMKEGNHFVTNKNLSSLRLLGTVGEPIKEPEWMWYHEIVGNSKCPIVDTWWQTETGGILISPLPGAIPTKPGSATLPFFGIEPVLLTQEGEEIKGNNVSGLLAIKIFMARSNENGIW